MNDPETTNEPVEKPLKANSWFTNFGKQIIAIQILFGIVITPLVYWLTLPIPTQIQADLIVDRISFRVGTAIELKQPIKFHSLIFTEFEHVQFTPSTLPFQPEHTRFTPNALPIQNAAALRTVHITSLDEQVWPTVIIDTEAPDAKHFGALHELTIAKGAEVELGIEAGEGVRKKLSITIDYKSSSSPAPFASLQHSGPFHIITKFCKIKGIKLPASFSVAGLWARNPSIDINGQSDTLKLILSLADEQNVEIAMAAKSPNKYKSHLVSGNISITKLPLVDDVKIAIAAKSSNRYKGLPRGIAITKLNLLRENIVMGEKIVESVIKSGRISYPAYPNIKPISFGVSNFSFFDQITNFKIESIVFEPSKNSFKISLNGLANKSVRTHPQGFPENIREYRLTHFETIPLTSKFVQLMFEILLWSIPILIGMIGIMTFMRIY